jgi:DNA-binding MarR family transcriptional regulator
MLSPRQEESRTEVTEDHVLSILCVRRGRDEVMGRGLFSDPAWDILLELYAARLGQRRMTLNELARSIGAPQSTVARWITVLTDKGLVIALTEADEAVRLWVELSAEGDAAMKRLVDHWGAAFRSI